MTWLKFLTISIALLVLFNLSLSIGIINLSLFDIYTALFGETTPERIAAELRLSRTTTALAVGVILGAAGAALQSVLRNPLASPYTIGIPQSAALGVALGLFIGDVGYIARGYLEIVNMPLVIFLAFLSALVNVFIVLALAALGGLSPVSIILAMVAVSAIYQSAIALMQYLFLNDLQTAAVVYWTFGDVGRTNLGESMFLSLLALSAVVVFWSLSNAYNLLTIGDDVAKTSGVDPRSLRIVTLVISAFYTAAAVSYVGVIGFVGLAAPNIARPIFGGGHKKLIPASAAIGGMLLLAADIVGRALKPPVIIPAGITMSFIGAAVVILVLLKMGRL
ncbi:MAG: iron ABC transporter permease [Pyrobaculum sp.]